MSLTTLRVGAFIGLAALSIFGSAHFARAAAEAPSLATPALLSLAQMSSGSVPELRVVSAAFDPTTLEGDRERIAGRMPRPISGGGSRPLVRRGMEALARYSIYRADESPTPWEDGIAPPSGEYAVGSDWRPAAGMRESELSSHDVASSAVAFSSALARDSRATVSWSGPTSHADRTASLISAGDGSPSSLVRSLSRLATPVLEMADALRAVHLNQVRLADDLTLKLNGRTGRHARCFAILTHRF